MKIPQFIVDFLLKSCFKLIPLTGPSCQLFFGKVSFSALGASILQLWEVWFSFVALVF